MVEPVPVCEHGIGARHQLDASVLPRDRWSDRHRTETRDTTEQRIEQPASLVEWSTKFVQRARHRDRRDDVDHADHAASSFRFRRDGEVHTLTRSALRNNLL